MVRIVDAYERESKDGDSFVLLIIQGKIEPVVSKTSGRPYLTARRTAIPCAFILPEAKQLIGTTLPGEVERHECDPYEFVVPETGKKVKCTHTYMYNPEPAAIEEVVG